MDRGFFDDLRPYSSRAQTNIEIKINSIHPKYVLSSIVISLGGGLCWRRAQHHSGSCGTSAYSWIAICFGWGIRLFSAFFRRHFSATSEFN